MFVKGVEKTLAKIKEEEIEKVCDEVKEEAERLFVNVKRGEGIVEVLDELNWYLLRTKKELKRYLMS